MKPLAHYWATLRRQPRPFRFLLSRLLWHSGLCRLVVIPRGAYRLRFYPSMLSVEYWLEPQRRGGDERFMAKHLQPGDVVVDVGANIGALSLAAAARVGPHGRVYAIEPHPRTFGFLRGNLALNRASNVVPVNVALGARAATVSFADLETDDCNAVIPGPGLRVRVDTLDNLLRGDPRRIALLKIDVEGYEKFVLEGATEALARTECIYFEACERQFRANGYGTGKVLGLLDAAGFEVHRLRDHAPGGAVPPDFIAEQVENLVAVRKQGPQEAVTVHR